LGERGDTPRNAGGAVDERDIGTGKRLQFVSQQREMRAGKDDDVDRIAKRLVAKPGNSIANGPGGDGKAMKLGLCGGDETRTSMSQHRLAGREARAQIVDIGLAHRGLGPKDTDHTACRHFRGRLDCGHRAHNGKIERGADMWKRDGGGGVAGYDREPRLIALDQPPKQRRDARGEFLVAFLAIGEPGVVGSIDDGRGRQQRACGPEHCEPAEAAVEKEDRGVGGGGVHGEPRSRRGAAAQSVGRFWRAFQSNPLIAPPGIATLARNANRGRGMTIFLLVAAGYLLGSIPFGVLLTRAFGAGDLRQIGSGNIGATNVLRTGRKSLAAATLLLDGAKGAVAVLLARHWLPELGDHGAMIAGAAAVIGHCYPVWLNFRGGKGVATMLGLALALAWPVGAVFAAVWLGTVLASRISSLGGMTGAVSAPLAALAFGFPVYAVGLAGLAVLLLWRHRENIARLRAGTEPRVGKKTGAA